MSKRLDIPSAKLTVVFPESKLPAIDPGNPAFVLVLGGHEIRGKVNPKADQGRRGTGIMKGVGSERRDQAGM
jgi:hypothetical protein